MRHTITTSVKDLLAHRRLLTVLLVLLVMAVVMIVYVAITLEASDLRVVTHYTAYGITHFYRDSWVYLLSFIGFAVVSMACMTGLCLKLLRQDRESLALLFGWVGVAMLALALIVYMHIAELA